MCIDANAGARRAARQRNKEKHANFQQKSLMFFNKETSLARAQNRNVMGYSRDLSDAYVRAIYTQGKGRLRNQKLVAAYFGKKKIDQGGRSRTFGRKQYQGLLRSQSEIEGITRNMFGRNMAYAQEGARRKFQAANAQARQKLKDDQEAMKYQGIGLAAQGIAGIAGDVMSYRGQERLAKAYGNQGIYERDLLRNYLRQTDPKFKDMSDPDLNAYITQYNTNL